MSILKRINIVRRTLMKGLTRNIGDSIVKHNAAPMDKGCVNRVLISRPNHRLGNLLLITPLVQEVSHTFPNCKIDLFVKGNLGSVVFKNYENVDKVINLPKKHFEQLLQYLVCWLRLKAHNYDLVINVVQNSSSGRLSTKFAASSYKFYGGNENNTNLGYFDFEHIAKGPVYNFRNYLSQLGFPVNNDEVPPLDLKLSLSELSSGKKMLQDLIKRQEKTICLFTYATGAKCYEKVWWTHFHERLKAVYSNVNFVEVLPVENVSQISFKEPTFYSKNIREIGAFIANTDLFIGADSGIMHLASAAGTPTIGLFSITQPEVYKPYGPFSVGLNTNETTMDEILEKIANVLYRNEIPEK